MHDHNKSSKNSVGLIIKRLIIFFLVTGGLTAADQAAKFLAEKYLRPKGMVYLIKGVFDLQYVQNTGAAFGLFSNRFPIFFVFAGIVIILCLVFFLQCPDNRRWLPLQLTTAMLCAGAAGNMIDRLFHGYVTDFLYFSLIDFPVFNIADIYVCVSCALLILLLFFYYTEEELSALTGKKHKPE